MLRRTLFAMTMLALTAFTFAAGVAPDTPLHAFPAVYTTPLDLPATNSTPAFSSAEQLCMQRTVYGEARGEPFAAQVAIAASMVTRSISGQFPADICKVAMQTDQYKGYRSTVTLKTDADARAWETASVAVNYATVGYGSLPPTYREVTYFHDISVKTTWSADRRVIGRLGSLVFYAKRA